MIKPTMILPPLLLNIHHQSQVEVEMQLKLRLQTLIRSQGQKVTIQKTNFDFL